MSLYWGVLFRVNANLRAIVVQVVDFDGQVAPYNNVQPVVGPAVSQITQQLFNSPEPSLGYVTLPASQFNYDPLQVREAVYRWDSWAAIVIYPNATALLQEAVATGNASYSPTGSVQIVIQTARDSTTVSSYILPQLDMFIEEFSASFGPMWASMVMSNTSLTRENLVSASAAVNPGVTPLLYDLRPFQPAVATPTVSIGLIYLIIMAFFSFSFFLPIHMVSLPIFSNLLCTSPGTDIHAEIHPAAGPSTSSLLAAHHMALGRHCRSVLSNQPHLLLDFIGLPDPLYATPCESRLFIASRGRHRIRPRHIPCVLARKLSRNVCAGVGMRECSYDRGSAMGSTLADLLGDYQCLNVLLQS